LLAARGGAEFTPRPSGDDGNVCLWKANFKGQWQLLSVVDGDDDDAEPTFISAKQDD
jgi:hypothetical protein